MPEIKKAKQVSEKKKKTVEEFVKLMKEYPIIGAVNMENLPAKQLQNMRAQLRETVVLKMAKRRLIKIAIDEASKDKPGLEKLVPYLKGMPALIFTKDNPFALTKTLQKNKSTAPIKAGQTAPSDIVVPAGPTGFAPGPVIGQLGGVGIKAGIDGGKVVIKADSKVASEGEEVSEDLAALLGRLEIEPMEIGLDLTAVYEDGEIFEKKVLMIDEQEYMDNIGSAHRWAFNLAMEAGILNKETTELMLVKAVGDAKALATEAVIYADEVMDSILAKANAQMSALASVTGSEA